MRKDLILAHFYFTGMVKRIEATAKAIDLIEQLKSTHGELMFCQAGGCCEGTQPQCFEKGGYYLRMNDVCIGEVAGCEFWVDKDLFDYWKYSHFLLDVTDGFGAGGFSLETPLNKTFIIHYTLFSKDDLDKLEALKFAQ